MAKPTITVKGINALVRDLKKLSPDAIAEIKEVNRSLASDVASAASSRVPRRTGALANSIRAGATQRSGVVRAGKKAVPYAGAIHFGWHRRNIRPNPFIWDALDSRKGEIERKWLDAMTEIVEKVN